MSDELRFYTDEELMIRNEGLIKVKNGLDSLGIDFFLMMGVLLGAVRENNFIKWDWDVELGFFTETLMNRIDEIKIIFEECGFNVEIVNRNFSSFKINLFYKSNKYTLWGLHFKGKWLQRKAFRFPKEHFLKFEEIKFGGEVYKIPDNSEELLKFIYGDWETPKKTLIKEDYLDKKVFNKISIIRKIINRVIK